MQVVGVVVMVMNGEGRRLRSSMTTATSSSLLVMTGRGATASDVVRRSL
jgi:hypothetical protein